MVGTPELTIDMATAVLPGLLYERLDELGIDVSVIYPSYGLLFMHFENEDDRRGSCRALNRFNAELFADLADRLIPVALIPMHTPEEAVAELEHAVGSLGMKAVVLAGFVQRPVDDVARQAPELAPWAMWLDTYGIDSHYDYDPVWEGVARRLGVSRASTPGARLADRALDLELRLQPHRHARRVHPRRRQVASLRRGDPPVPRAHFAFLEGGVAWACSLFADLIGHWEKRNGPNDRPASTRRGSTVEEMMRLFATYGGRFGRSELDVRGTRPSRGSGHGGRVRRLWRRAGRGHRRTLRAPVLLRLRGRRPAHDQGVQHQGQPLRLQAPALFGSDISHWDVPDMSEVGGGSLGAGRARGSSPRPTIGTSCSPTP